MTERISILTPFRNDHGPRAANWRWLRKYYRSELPHAEIVVGHDHGGEPFSKTNAINDAAGRAKGDVFVLMDADCFIEGKYIEHCAERIRSAQKRDVPLWFMPYRNLFRLSEDATHRVITSYPSDPVRFPSPPDPDDIDQLWGALYGAQYGALIMIMPREAFELVGCMDRRFRGWGGEDVSLLRALDTLYGKHKGTPNDVLHLWHPRFVPESNVAVWPGQTTPRANDWLSSQYGRASYDPMEMWPLVTKGCQADVPKKFRYWILNRLSDLWSAITAALHRVKVFLYGL